MSVSNLLRRTAWAGFFLAAPFATAQELLYEYQGQADDWLLGTAVASFAELNGDSIPEFAISAVGARRSRGLVRVYDGATGQPMYGIRGPDWGLDGGAPHGFGAIVVRAGDVNGDGVQDLAIGAPGFNDVEFNVGAAYVYSGVDGSALSQVFGSEDREALGMSIAAVGDIDGDGSDDYATGAPFGTPAGGAMFAGVVRVHSGQSGTVLVQIGGSASSDEFGHAMAQLGDLDGDGIAELAIGAPQGSNFSGYVRVVSGANGATQYQIPGIQNGDLFGAAVVRSGDHNGDGVDDWIAAASQRSNGGPGYVEVRSGTNGALIMHLDGQAGISFGRSIGSGDVNDDGVPDVFVTAPQNGPDPARGLALIFDGTNGVILYRFEGTEAGDYLGHTAYSVAGLGDLDGDGLAEIGLSAANASRGGQSRVGEVQIIRGNDLYLLATPRQPAEGDLLTLSQQKGVPGNPVLLVLTSLGGSPLFRPILLSNFDAQGTASLMTNVPVGVSGLQASFQSFAVGSGGSVIDSAEESIVVQ